MMSFLKSVPRKSAANLSWKDQKYRKPLPLRASPTYPAYFAAGVRSTAKILYDRLQGSTVPDLNLVDQYKFKGFMAAINKSKRIIDRKRISSLRGREYPRAIDCFYNISPIGDHCVYQ